MEIFRNLNTWKRKTPFRRERGIFSASCYSWHPERLPGASASHDGTKIQRFFKFRLLPVHFRRQCLKYAQDVREERPNTIRSLIDGK